MSESATSHFNIARAFLHPSIVGLHAHPLLALREPTSLPTATDVEDRRVDSKPVRLGNLRVACDAMHERSNNGLAHSIL